MVAVESDVGVPLAVRPGVTVSIEDMDEEEPSVVSTLVVAIALLITP
jgi:hypothetical protein